ncbi:rhodanese-like domain-containing protein [Wenzhouxiangella sp. XN79A]|uniref:rhodanese-like domain-containing protein n=1 Tax=Wenzhouxiangella sp. XN79A TaxID=2724193 RepID=UPI00144ADF68|nr:rhodanese-like domain-containing protein [Wenzhouxiangella sp. XN79A]NKI35223.1 rhodanese-like domain-containing protein [Wenzhouxiangella sp. XN79A]
MRIARNLRIALPALLALLLAAPLMAQDASDDGPNIYPQLAARLVELDVPTLDVRTDEEVAETGMAPNATHIPHGQIDAIAEFLGDDPNRAVVVYCRSGRRAELVVEAMRERGYGGLVNAGGYSDLTEALDNAD